MAQLTGATSRNQAGHRAVANARCGSPARQAGRRARSVVDEGFDRAWRRVGLALDRVGFTVEDRDRVQGIYFVRYVDPDKAKEGFFSKLFGGEDKNKEAQRYRVLVSAGAEYHHDGRDRADQRRQAGNLGPARRS
jgi:outer membrane protein assembly factor BamC